VGIAGAVATALACAASTAATAAAAAMPTTLAVTTRPVIALAAGGGRVAYRTHLAAPSGVCNSVHVLALSGGHASVPSPCSHTDDHGHGLALGAHVLVFDSVDVTPWNATHDGAETTLWRVGPGGKTQLATETYEITCSGSGIGPFAYGAGVAFTRTVMTEVDPAMECLLGSGGGDGVSRMTSATMRYVPAGSTTPVTISGAPGASRIAARWPALAIVPLRIPQPMGHSATPTTRGTSKIESWNLRTQTRRCTANLAGVPTAVATNGVQIAAIVPTSPGHRLVRISARTCARLTSRALGGHIQPELAMGRNVIAWVSGRSVMALNTSTGRVSRLYRGMLVPHGLVLSNGRLVWWVNGANGSRVLRLPLP